MSSEVISRLISELKPHPRNYNNHSDKQVDDLALSLKKFGQRKPIVTWRNMIVAGHGLTMAAQMAGWTSILTMPIPDDWDEATVLAYLAADNELARQADPDLAQLAAITKELEGIDEELAKLAAGGDDALKALMATIEDENPNGDAEPQIDKAEELRQKWDVQSGQMWQLGEHRIICGDCTDRAVVERVMGGEQIESLFFDPEWDNMPAPPIFKIALVFTDGGRIGDSIRLFGSPAWLFTWDCVSCWYTPNRPLKRTKHCLWYGDVSNYIFDGSHYGDAGEERTVWNSRGEYTFKPDSRGKHLADLYSTPITQLHANSEHGHSKPLDWIRMLIANCTTGTIFDGFSGSGVSIIACEQLNRKCRAVEISPAYVAVSIQRWVDVTGKEPILL